MTYMYMLILHLVFSSLLFLIIIEVNTSQVFLLNLNLCFNDFMVKPFHILVKQLFSIFRSGAYYWAPTRGPAESSDPEGEV